MLVYTLAALAFIILCLVPFRRLHRAEYKQRISVTRWSKNGQPLDRREIK